MPSAEHANAGLDIVHLVRDPRAITLSQEKHQMGLWAQHDAPAETGQKRVLHWRKMFGVEFGTTCVVHLDLGGLE